MLKKLTCAAVLLITLLSVCFRTSFVACADNEADKTALRYALQIAETMEEADYTAASYQQLHTLYQTWSAAFDTLDSQIEIDTATAQLLEAVNALTPYLTLKTEANIDSVDITVNYQGQTTTDSTCSLVYGTMVTVTAPETNGYWFAGWLETVSKRILSDEAQYTFPVSVNTSLRALYFKEGDAALLFGTEGGCVLGIAEKSPEEWATVTDLSVFAPDVPYHYGYTNGRWDIPSDTLASLIAGEFIFVYPVYDETESNLPAISAPADDTIRLELHYQYDATAKVGSFIMNADLPDGVIPESIGTLFYYKKAASFDPTQFYVNNNNKMLVSQFDSLTDEIYITNMKKMTATYNWAVRGYATYYENGELKTVYSNQVNIVRTADIHDYRHTDAVAPTCTTEGYTDSEACFICGDVTAERTVIPALGHDYTSAVTQPTCTENGYITYTCTRCGDTRIVAPEWSEEAGEYTHPELLATGHRYEITTVTTPATLSDIGEAEAVCTVCGAQTQEPYYIATGSCGEVVTYSFDHRTGTLTLSGNGAMTDYESPSSSPFYQMTNLEHLVTENGVTRIGDSAFYGCNALSDIALADSVTDIGNRTFYSCASLAEAALGSGLTTIDYFAFYGCALTEVTFPASLQTIGNDAFSHCNALTQVTLPGTLHTVGSSAFTYCEALQSVVIEAGIDTMGSAVFSNCTALSDVTLANGVTIIESNTFDGCSSLSNVQLPDSLFLIGNQAFKGCTSLSALSLPHRLATIEAGAFVGCTGLTELTLPVSLTTIGNTAFADCVNLTTQLPSQLQSLGSEAFRNCLALTTITIPDTLTNLANSVFNGCSGLTSVTLSETLTSIGNYSFYHCSALNAIAIPAATEAIGNNAFTGCSGLTSITVDSDNTVYDSRGGCQAIIETATDRLIIGCRNTVIPNGVTRLENYAFSGNTALTAIVIPSSVTAIGTHVFDGCTALTAVTVPDNVTTLGEYTFSGCTSLESITLPSQLKTVSKGLLSGCTALEAVTIPTTVKTIEAYAVQGCSSLTALSLPDGITSLGSSAFADCIQLQSVNIPSGISSLPSRAFSNCAALTGITIPGNIRSIGTYAFSGCSSLTAVDLPNTVTTLSIGAFRDCSSLGHIYIRNLGCKIGQNATTIPEQTVIHSYLSSTAKTYADTYGRSFQTLT